MSLNHPELLLSNLATELRAREQVQVQKRVETERGRKCFEAGALTSSLDQPLRPHAPESGFASSLGGDVASAEDDLGGEQERGCPESRNPKAMVNRVTGDRGLEEVVPGAELVDEQVWAHSHDWCERRQPLQRDLFVSGFELEGLPGHRGQPEGPRQRRRRQLARRDDLPRLACLWAARSRPLRTPRFSTRPRAANVRGRPCRRCARDRRRVRRNRMPCPASPAAEA
jgi:hypothetical protein